MHLPDFITPQLVVSAVTIGLMVHIVLILVAYLVMAERKVSAYIQDRIGPNRVGFDFGLEWLAPLKGCLGLGQPLADGLKFILKEDFTPSRVDKVLFTLAPIIVVVPALMGFIIIPWGGVWDGSFLFGTRLFTGNVHVVGAHINIGFVYLLAIGSLGVYGVTLGGWAANNKFSFLGGLRATAQMISYEIPMGLALLTALLAMGTVLPDEIVRHQTHNGWLMFSQPLAAVIFLIAILAEANRAPFDNAECEQELVGGFHTEYSSMRFALFFLAEYSHLVTSSAFFVLLFMGGYQLLPFVHDPLTNPEATSFLAMLAKFGVYIGKVVGVAVGTMVIRWTIPRLRYDQVMMSGWNLVIPLALAQVVVVAAMTYMGWTGLAPMLAANAALVGLLLIVIPFIPRSKSNRRIPLYGSRFSPMPGEIVSSRPTDPMALADHPTAT